MQIAVSLEILHLGFFFSVFQDSEKSNKRGKKKEKKPETKKRKRILAQELDSSDDGKIVSKYMTFLFSLNAVPSLTFMLNI